MDLPGSTYLYTLAALSVTFVGFSALVIILRQTVGEQMSRLDILITRIFIQLGFMVAASAMLPPLLSLFQLSAGLVWRMASIFTAIPSLLFAATYPGRRRAGEPAPGPFAAALTVILFLAGWAYLQVLQLLLRPHLSHLREGNTAL